MSAAAPGGLLLVLEGAEGVGKTTQVRRLAATLVAAGVDAHAFREPGGTPLGEGIRALLLDPTRSGTDDEVAPRAEALLFMAARAQLVGRVRALLASGAVVLLDRFFLSTWAYQVAGRGLPEADVLAANRLATGDLRPDLTLLLTGDPAVARARAESRGTLDRMERAGAGFHARVHAAFVAALDPAWQAARPALGPVVAVPADGAEAAVAARLLGVLADRWPARFGHLAHHGASADGDAETFRSQGESHPVAGG